MCEKIDSCVNPVMVLEVVEQFYYFPGNSSPFRTVLSTFKFLVSTSFSNPRCLFILDVSVGVSFSKSSVRRNLPPLKLESKLCLLSEYETLQILYDDLLVFHFCLNLYY